LKIGPDCLIGAGALVTRDLPENALVKGVAGEPHAKIGARAYFKVGQ
jgi:acetyltransferase-like isoleucine patch superfamily enzyme